MKAPADGAQAVAWTPPLDWGDAPRARSYQLYLWQANTVRPASPLASSLSASVFTVKDSLTKNTEYWWQVAAVNGVIKISGPI